MTTHPIDFDPDETATQISEPKRHDWKRGPYADPFTARCMGCGKRYGPGSWSHIFYTSCTPATPAEQAEFARVHAAAIRPVPLYRGPYGCKGRKVLRFKASAALPHAGPRHPVTGRRECLGCADCMGDGIG